MAWCCKVLWYLSFLKLSFPPPPTPFFLQSTPRHSRCLQYAWLTVLNTVLASNILLGLIYPQPLLPVFQCRMSALLCSSQSFIFTGQFETCILSTVLPWSLASYCCLFLMLTLLVFDGCCLVHATSVWPVRHLCLKLHTLRYLCFAPLCIGASHSFFCLC